MILSCPECGSRQLRRSHRRSLLEKMGRWFGYVSIRCLDCSERFSANLLMPRTWIYAKCPRCYRTDLSSWDPSHYRCSLAMRLKLLLFARRVRCEACRVNFASWRLRERWYRRPQAVPVTPPQAPAQAPAHALDQALDPDD
jgi:hypothetical protein